MTLNLEVYIMFRFILGKGVPHTLQLRLSNTIATEGGFLPSRTKLLG